MWYRLQLCSYRYVYWQLWTWLIQSHVHCKLCILLTTFYTFFCCFGFTCLTVFWPYRKTLILNIDFTLISEALVLLEISTALGHSYWTFYIITECLCWLSTCQYKSLQGICIDCVVLLVSLCHLMSAVLSNMVLRTDLSVLYSLCPGVRPVHGSIHRLCQADYRPARHLQTWGQALWINHLITGLTSRNAATSLLWSISNLNLLSS